MISYFKISCLFLCIVYCLFIVTTKTTTNIFLPASSSSLSACGLFVFEKFLFHCGDAVKQKPATSIVAFDDETTEFIRLEHLMQNSLNVVVQDLFSHDEQEDSINSSSSSSSRHAFENHPTTSITTNKRRSKQKVLFVELHTWKDYYGPSKYKTGEYYVSATWDYALRDHGYIVDRVSTRDRKSVV